MTPEMIAAIAGIVLSLALEYVPKLKDWYNALEDKYQKLIPLGVGLLVVYGAFGLGCAALIAAYWPCDGPGAVQAFYSWLAFVAANQTIYALAFKKAK